MDEEYVKNLSQNADREIHRAKTNKVFFIVFAFLVIASISSFFVLVLPNLDMSDMSSFFKNITSSSKEPENSQANVNDTEYPSNGTELSVYDPDWCNELWNCTTGWSECYNFTQNRTCVDLNECPNPVKKPVTERQCCSWTCTNWSECYHHTNMTNVQVRQCEPDNESCNFEINEKPPTGRDCNYTNPCTDTEEEVSLTIRGTVTDKNNIQWKDVCENKSLLVEYSCDEFGNTLKEKYPCEDPTPFCLDGICVEVYTPDLPMS